VDSIASTTEHSVVKTGSSIAYVQPATIEEFSAGDKIHVATYKYEAPYDLIAARAMKAIWSGQYSFVTRNCEHFATYCKTGCGISLQVNNVLTAISSVSQFMGNMQTRLDSANTLSALKKMPLAALHLISAFADKQAKKFSVDTVSFK